MRVSRHLSVDASTYLRPGQPLLGGVHGAGGATGRGVTLHCMAVTSGHTTPGAGGVKSLGPMARKLIGSSFFCVRRFRGGGGTLHVPCRDARPFAWQFKPGLAPQRGTKCPIYCTKNRQVPGVIPACSRGREVGHMPPFFEIMPPKMPPLCAGMWQTCADVIALRKPAFKGFSEGKKKRPNVFGTMRPYKWCRGRTR